MEKACARCGESKPASEFCRARNRKDGLYPYCKPCKRTHGAAYRERHPDANRIYRQTHSAEMAASAKAWRERNKSHLAAYEKERHKRRAAAGLKDDQRRRKYGITGEQYASMVAAQSGLCAICGGSPGRYGLSVDHCHASGVVRGLLCVPCNTSLGKMKDSPARLRAAAEYLEQRVNGIVATGAN